jgi:hypothetical protein
MIREKLWKDLVAVARKRGQRAESLAQNALSEYLQRVTDEDLLHRSERAAHKAKFRIGDTEQIIRKWRRSRQGI